jgi:guanylate kinase
MSSEKINGKLVIISAPSGAGKTTIVKYLLNSGLNLAFSVSATTRSVRNNEKDGRDYYFLTPEAFRRMISNDELVEWQEVYKDHYYGTPKSEIQRIWTEKKHVLFDVDVMGGINLKKIFGKSAISIFIRPPSIGELEKRLINRGTDDIEKIKMRVEKASEEMKQSGEFDHIIVNDNLEKAQEEAYRIVKDFIGK